MLEKKYIYSAKILKVIDGDTVKVEIDCGFEIAWRTNLRLARIDAPEIRGQERPQGLVSKAELIELLGDKDIVIHTTQKGKYGRYLAEIWIEQDDQWINVNDWMVEQNLAAKY